MARRRVDDIEDDRPLRVEADRPPPAKRQAVRLADLSDKRVGGIEIDSLRLEAAQAEDDRPVRRVAAPGEGERTEQRDLDACDARDRAGLREPGGESGRRLHRPDRMRGRRTDADLEQVEDADHGWASRGSC